MNVTISFNPVEVFRWIFIVVWLGLAFLMVVVAGNDIEGNDKKDVAAFLGIMALLVGSASVLFLTR